jgi:hypothetical protein
MSQVTIGSLERTATTTGKPVIDLFSTDTRLQYPVLRLFDLSELQTVGIDPDVLQPGRRIHRRFIAHYTESTKTTANGNPYRDVTYLEPIPVPTDTGAPDTDILNALNQIIALLQTIAHHTAPRTHDPSEDLQPKLDLCPDCNTHPCLCHHLSNPLSPRGRGPGVRGHPTHYPDAPSPEAGRGPGVRGHPTHHPDAPGPEAGRGPGVRGDDPTLRYADGDPVADNDAEIAAYLHYTKQHNGHPPPSRQDLRSWYAASVPTTE